MGHLWLDWITFGMHAYAQKHARMHFKKKVKGVAAPAYRFFGIGRAPIWLNIDGGGSSMSIFWHWSCSNLAKYRGGLPRPDDFLDLVVIHFGKISMVAAPA